MDVNAYITYLIISICIAVAVATFLYKSGHPFLLLAFHGDQRLAVSVNRLLVVGFYLINIGFICLFSVVGEPVQTPMEFLKYVCWKVGLVLFILGGMHFFNLAILLGVSRKARTAAQAPPLPAPKA
jgi:hypothetical protein